MMIVRVGMVIVETERRVFYFGEEVDRIGRWIECEGEGKRNFKFCF